MKRDKRVLSLIAVLLFIIFMPLSSYAAEDIDLNRPASITISYQTDDTAITGAKFNIYKVASIDKNGVFTVTDEFSGINIDISRDGEKWRNTALALEGYVDMYNILPEDTAMVDSHGYGYFMKETSIIPKGLYLILGERHTMDGVYYDSDPVLVSLPSQLRTRSSSWVYDVIVNMKFARFSLKPNQTVEYTVMKVWESDVEGITHPESISIHLLQDGEDFEKVVLSEENNWRYSWTGLSAYSEWSVYEEHLGNYNVEISKQGTTYIVKNTYIPEPAKPTPLPTDKPNPVATPSPDNPSNRPDIPSFGQLWWPVPVLLASGLICIILGLAQRKGSLYEE